MTSLFVSSVNARGQIQSLQPAVGSMKTALVMSVVLAILVVIVMLVLTFVERIDPEREQTVKMFYFTADDIHVNWTVARGECSGRLVPGALLATIDSQEERERFLETVPKGHPEHEGPRLYWLDGTNLLERGGWVWGSTRKPVDEGLLDWEVSTLSKGGPQCLAVLVHAEPFAVRWTNLRCDTDMVGFVCQYYDWA